MICNNDVLKIFLKVFTKQFPLVFLCTNQGPSSKKVRRTIIFMNGAFVNMQLATVQSTIFCTSSQIGSDGER